MKFCPIHYIHLISHQLFLQASFNNFLHENHLNNQQEAEDAFQEFVKRVKQDFTYRNKQNYIFYWQKWVNCNGSYFDLINNVFEPSYDWF